MVSVCSGAHLFSSDGKQRCLDQQCQQYDGPAIAVRHVQLVQPCLQSKASHTLQSQSSMHASPSHSNNRIQGHI